MSSISGVLLDSLQPFAISLLIGLGTGIERERNQAVEQSIMGMRTFALIAILGTLAAHIGSSALIFGLVLFVTVLVLAGYWRSTSNPPPATDGQIATPDMGLTTEIAAGVVFGLGFLAKAEPLLAATLGILLVAILYFRKRLHWFARDVLRPQEIAAAILLAVFVFVVIPFLPNEAIDPWNLVNPRQLAQVVALIAAIEFCGYASERFAGPKVGILLTGFLGGFASSTVVFLSMSKAASKQADKMRSIIGACSLAIVSPLLLYLLILNATAPSLMVKAGIPVLAAAIAACFLGIAIGRRAESIPKSSDQQRSPLDLRSLAKLGAFISGLLILSSLMQNHLGAQAVGLVSFVGGLFELHGVTLATATLHAAGNLADIDTTRALLLGVLASFVSKLAIAWFLAPGRFALLMTALISVIVAVGATSSILLMN
ncbi:MAG: MgtC/SapB family protein [Oligoflexus sp.]